jgi:hypothetical protein
MLINANMVKVNKEFEIRKYMDQPHADIKFETLWNHFNSWGSMFMGDQNSAGLWGLYFMGNHNAILVIFIKINNK